MTTKQIKEAFQALSYVFSAATYNYAEILFTECAREEREHRGFLDSFKRCHTADSIGISDAARLFAVKRVAEYLLSKKYPCGADYLHMQKSCFTAAGIAQEFGEQIQTAWGSQVLELSKLDYTQFVKIKREEAA